MRAAACSPELEWELEWELEPELEPETELVPELLRASPSAQPVLPVARQPEQGSGSEPEQGSEPEPEQVPEQVPKPELEPEQGLTRAPQQLDAPAERAASEPEPSHRTDWRASRCRRARQVRRSRSESKIGQPDCIQVGVSGRFDHLLRAGVAIHHDSNCRDLGTDLDESLNRFEW